MSDDQFVKNQRAHTSIRRQLVAAMLVRAIAEEEPTLLCQDRQRDANLLRSLNDDTSVNSHASRLYETGKCLQVFNAPIGPRGDVIPA